MAYINISNIDIAENDLSSRTESCFIELQETDLKPIVGGAYSNQQMTNQQMLSAESQKLNFLMQAINTTISSLSQAMDTTGST